MKCKTPCLVPSPSKVLEGTPSYLRNFYAKYKYVPSYEVHLRTFVRRYEGNFFAKYKYVPRGGIQPRCFICTK